MLKKKCLATGQVGIQLALAVWQVNVLKILETLYSANPIYTCPIYFFTCIKTLIVTNTDNLNNLIH